MTGWPALDGGLPAWGLRRGRAVNVNAPEFAIPSDVLRKWQRIVDLLADVMHVPSAVVTRLEPPYYTHYRTVAANGGPANPFPVDETFSMDIGTFCETVIKNCEPLLVANALEDEKWTSAPEIQVGMVSYLGFPVLWPDGQMFGTICVLDDKTNAYSDSYHELLSHCRDVLQADLQALARLSSELEEQKAHLRELFERVPEAIVMVDRHSRIMRVNPAFTNIFGYTADEAIGARITDLIVPDDRQDEVESFLYRLIETREVFAVETVRKDKGGTRVPVSLMCVPVSSHGSGDTGYVIYRDISETKRLHEERQRYHESQLALAHANRIATIGQLSASIAHELNQPLTGLVTNCSTALRMLTSEPVNADGATEAVRRAIRDGNRAADVVARVRALFNNRPPASELVDLNEAAREVIALSLDELQKGRVTARAEFADGLPRVTADRVQLQQVVLNLLRNAVDAMDTVEGRPRDLLIRTEPEGAGRVRLSVVDAGIGFDPRDVDRLFGAFYSTKSDGMGVGLAVSRSIVENHQGRLWAVLNEDGPGATFALSMPCRTFDGES
jgi:PAS domain S-box-containing protein